MCTQHVQLIVKSICHPALFYIRLLTFYPGNLMSVLCFVVFFLFLEFTGINPQNAVLLYQKIKTLVTHHHPQYQGENSMDEKEKTEKEQ